MSNPGVGAWGEEDRRWGIILAVTRRATQMQLSIEIDSDPIAGSVAVEEGAPQRFSGWIELVATIESARQEGPSGGEDGLRERAGATGGRV
jgi:hypothetical protein